MVKNNTKGITLIALVITIIVLLILVGITIATLTGDNGVLKKAIVAKEKTNLENERERLELIKASVVIDHDGKITVDQYIEQLVIENIIVGEIEEGDNNSKNIVTDNGYSVNIEQKSDKDISITIEGEVGKLKVLIKQVTLTSDSDNIKVDVQVKRGEGAIYQYYYKTDKTEYQLVGETTKTSYTIENLEPDRYTIKVVAINANGSTFKEEVGIIEQITAQEIEQGKYINMESGNQTIKCRVLWDSNSTYGKNGIHIVAMDTVEKIKFRIPQASESDALIKNWNSYLNAIETLNNKAREYSNTSFCIEARSIGSVPNNPYFKNTNTGYVGQQLGDENYISDYEKMKELGIDNIKKDYWLASRYSEIGTWKYASVRFVNLEGKLKGDKNASRAEQIFYWDTGSWHSVLDNDKGLICGLRPVFILKKDAKIKGLGTAEKPYYLTL